MRAAVDDDRARPTGAAVADAFLAREIQTGAHRFEQGDARLDAELVPLAVDGEGDRHLARPGGGLRLGVSGAGGHFSIDVESPVFAGKSMLASQRLVYAAITPLMSGDMAPVHAVDSLRTRVPSA